MVGLVYSVRMKMDNKEDVLSALEDFSQKPSEPVPDILEEYLRHIAKTGMTIFPWSKLKPLFTKRLEQAITEFHERCPNDQPSVISPNVEDVSFEAMRQRLVEAVKTFSGAPFTIQRLCELIISPGKHYRCTDKYLRGIEKNVMVVSTVDPMGRKIVSESLQHMVNGIESTPCKPSDNSLADKVKSPFVPPAPSNSPIVSNNWLTTTSTPASDSVLSQLTAQPPNTDASSSVDMDPEFQRIWEAEIPASTKLEAVSSASAVLEEIERSAGLADSSESNEAKPAENGHSEEESVERKEVEEKEEGEVAVSTTEEEQTAAEPKEEASHADDIECRRESGGFETSAYSSTSTSSSLSSSDAADETGEPSPKKPRLDEDVVDVSMKSESTEEKCSEEENPQEMDAQEEEEKESTSSESTDIHQEVSSTEETPSAENAAEGKMEEN